MIPYKRILLKISGEALLGKIDCGIDAAALKTISEKIIKLREKGVQIAIVTGGGNIFRGLSQKNGLALERTPADQMGMLATLINGLALKNTLIQLGAPTTMMSALQCPQVAEPYHWEKAMDTLNNGSILLFVGGTGHPYFTTDTAAALRASEIKADLLLKMTQHVDGIYDKDPRQDKNAVKFDRLTYLQYVEKKLAIMDLTAITLCMTNNIPIKVCNLKESFIDALLKEKNIGTLVE